MFTRKKTKHNKIIEINLTTIFIVLLVHYNERFQKESKNFNGVKQELLKFPFIIIPI